MIQLRSRIHARPQVSLVGEEPAQAPVSPTTGVADAVKTVAAWGSVAILVSLGAMLIFSAITAESSARWRRSGEAQSEGERAGFLSGLYRRARRHTSRKKAAAREGRWPDGGTFDRRPFGPG